MYFLNKGTCNVRVQAQQGKDPVTVCVLAEGDHFGEIHMIYHCPRSATVISNNYNTLAALKRDNYADIVSQYPEFETQLRHHVIKVYGDMKGESIGRVLDPRI